MTPLLFELYADYYQFYLQDEGVSGDLGDSWNQAAVDRLLAVAPGVIGVGTVRNATVPVEVELLDAPPHDDFSRWDRISECTLEVASGRIVIAGCTDYFPDAARIEVLPGTYRARVYHGGLEMISEDELEGSDHYRIALWQAPPGPLLEIRPPVS